MSELSLLPALPKLAARLAAGLNDTVLGKRLAEYLYQRPVIQRRLLQATGINTTTAVYPATSVLIPDPVADPLITTGGDLEFTLTCSYASSAALFLGWFAVYLDGVLVGCGTGHSHVGLFRISSAAGTFKATGVPAGQHTVEVKWAKGAFDAAGTTLTVNATPGMPTSQHCSLLIEERAA